MVDFVDISTEELRNRALTNLVAGGKITNVAPGSLARQLVDIGIEQIAELFDALNFYSLMTRLSTAAGSFLDEIGNVRGIKRQEASAATISAEDRVIKFYSSDGVTPLYTLLPSQKIPKDTIIYSSDNTIQYIVTEDAFVDQLQTEVYVSATSSSVGSSQNVGANVLTIHNLGLNNVSVTNISEIDTATDTESDTSYRSRISAYLHLRTGGTEAAMRNAILQFPDVADVRLIEHEDGIGTVTALIIPKTTAVSSLSMSLIKETLERVASFGIIVNVKQPDIIPVDIGVKLLFRDNTSIATQNNIRSVVRRNILSYLSSLVLGGTFIYNELVQTVMNSSDSILDMKVVLYRFDNEPHILQNIRAAENELFVPNPDSSNPIQVI